MAAEVVLEITSGPIRGQQFRFDAHNTFVFGRGKGCHAKLSKDGYVSRHHFLLEVNPPRATVRDLGSLNGTHVNGVRYGGRTAESGRRPGDARPIEVDLKHNDQIMVGNTTIQVRIHAVQTPTVDEFEAPPTLPAGPPPAAGGYSPTFTEQPLPTGDRSAGPPDPKAHEIPQQALENMSGNPSPLPAHQSEQEGGLRQLIQQAARAYRDEEVVTIEGYELGGMLGKGGMGTVYRATRRTDGLPVAVKFTTAKVALNERVRNRFLREIDVLRQLAHPNIASLIEAGSVGKTFYFVMDYCNGGNMADLAVRNGGQIELRLLGAMMLQILCGLEHAHRNGFVHRDLKPANLLLHQQGMSWQAKLGDFGLAKHFEQAGLSGMTLTGTFGGTYDYMAREQLTDFRNAKPSADIWAIGACFYRLLTGCPPRFASEERDAIEVVLCDEPAPIRHRDPNIPANLAAVIDRALQSRPEARFCDAQEMRAALEEVL